MQDVETEPSCEDVISDQTEAHSETDTTTVAETETSCEDVISDQTEAHSETDITTAAVEARPSCEVVFSAPFFLFDLLNALIVPIYYTSR